jgi:molybdenum cofactor cytidylyltransferase
MPQNEQHILSFGVIILAAGASSRMGRPKLLLPWGETSVLGHLIVQWQSLQAEQIVVVCTEDDGAIRGELDRVGFPTAERIFNPAPERGMFSSIQCAARWAGWKEGLSHFAIVLGDQPHLSPAILSAVLDFTAANPEKICQPSRRGRARHPVLLPRIIFAQLRDAAKENLKAFLQSRSHDVALCDIDDPALDLDMDSPAEYEQIVRLFGKRES